MEAKPTPFVGKIAPYLRYLEIAALLLSVIGLGLLYSSDPPTARQLIMVGFSALAMVYYLYAFTLPPEPEQEFTSDSVSSPKGFVDLLPVIIRKVAYIGCAVALIGLLFGLLNLTGSNQLLMIGCSTLVISLLLSGFLILRNNASLHLLRGPLQRGLPILILSCYWAYIHWPPIV